MPLFRLRCPKCGHYKGLITSKRFLDLGPAELTCPKCNYLLKRCGQGPTTNVKEKLDNGSMVRSVERFHNAEELHQERIRNADPEAGKTTTS